ncbi:protein mono-ADP-ribosyltransferase PARP14-like isoform X2 [Lampetra planeri]
MEGSSSSNEVDVSALPALNNSKILKYFQSKRQSEGGECEESTRLPGGGVRLRFKEREAMDRVLAKQEHVLDIGPQRYELTVRRARHEQIKQPEPANPLLQDEPSSEARAQSGGSSKQPFSTIKVEKMENADTEFVSMYFESERRSGGGDIATVEEEKKYWVITFADPAVAERVLKQKHIIKGTEVVCSEFIITSAKPREESLDPRRILLSGFAGPEDKDTLKMFIENCSKTEEFDIEDTDNISYKVVTFVTDIDVHLFISRCETKSHRKTKIKAVQLPVTKIVQIENLPELVADEDLEIYFDRKHVKVEKVEVSTADSTAMIHLSSFEDVEKILQEKWRLKNRSLLIHRYYQKYALAVVPWDGEAMKLPDAQTLKVDAHVMGFVVKHPGEFKEHLKQNKATFQWPAQDSKELLMIEPDISKSESHYVVLKNWPKTIQEEMKLFFDKYSYSSEKVDSQIFDVLASRLLKYEKDTIEITSDRLNNQVHIVGLKSDVNVAMEQLSALNEKLTSEVEISKNNKQMELVVKQRQFDLIKQNGFDKRIGQIFPDVTIQLDLGKKSVVLEGPKDDCAEMYSKLVQLTMQFSEKYWKASSKRKSFLLHMNHEDFVQNTFIKHGIEATIGEIGGDIMVIGASDENLITAVSALENAITETVVKFEHNFDIKQHSTDWENFVGNLNNSGDVSIAGAEDVSFKIHCDKQEGKEVVIVGLRGVTNDVGGKIKQFISDFSTETVFIPLRSNGVLNYIDKFCDLSNQLPAISKIKKGESDQTIGYTVTLKAKDKDEVIKHFDDLSTSIVSKMKCIKKPGGAKFLHERGTIFLDSLEVTHKVIIILDPAEEQQEEESQKANHAEVVHKTSMNGISVSIQKGKMQLQCADAMVITVDEHLQSVGYLAKMLVDVGGPAIQSERDRKVASNGGPFNAGDAVLTGAGMLPCKFLINMVGVKWDDQLAMEKMDKFKQAVTKSIERSVEKQCKSIAIPTLNSEAHFEFSQSVYCQMIIKAVKAFCHMHAEGTSMRDIRLITADDTTAIKIKEFFLVLFGKEDVPASGSGLFCTTESEKPAREEARYQPKPMPLDFPYLINKSAESYLEFDTNVAMDPNVYETKSGLRVKLVKGNLENELADVIVNTVSKDLDLSKGAVSGALLKKAGPLLQTLTNEISQKKSVIDGDIITVKISKCNLSCKEVYHTVCCQWNAQGKKTLEHILESCFKKADASNYATMAIPAIGTGNLNYPKNVTAEIFFKEMKRFSKRNPKSPLKDISIVVYGQDTDTFETFHAELQKKNAKKMKKSVSEVVKETRRKGHEEGQPQKHQRYNDGFYYNLQETALGSLQMNFGKVEVLITQGNIVKEHTDAIINVTTREFYSKTGVCSAIINAAGPTVQDMFSKQVTDSDDIVVTESGNLNFKYIIHIVNFKEDFTKQLCNTLYRCEMLKITSIALPAIGTGNHGLSPRGAAAIILDAVAEFSVQRKPRSLLQVKVVVFMAEMVQDFHEELLSRSKKSAPVERGIMPAVTRKFQSFPSWVRNRRHSQTHPSFEVVEIEPVQLQVFSNKEENIDKAYLQKQKTISIKDRKAFVEFNRNELSYEDGPTLKIKRKNTLDVIPSDWVDEAEFRGHRMITVELKSRSRNYQEVERHFKQSLGKYSHNPGFTIEEIIQIQNPVLWKLYATKKSEMDIANKGSRMEALVERILYHGTAHGTCETINTNGFNRSYCGKNAVVYGNGVYFAVNASYSAHNKYSPPDANGSKWIYRARVLTGDYTLGTKGMIEPPPRDRSVSSALLYDSVTDDKNPEVFVIFNDTQAYPEYLIKFKLA